MCLHSTLINAVGAARAVAWQCGRQGAKCTLQPASRVQDAPGVASATPDASGFPATLTVELSDPNTYGLREWMLDARLLASGCSLRCCRRWLGRCRVSSRSLVQ